MRNSLLLAAVVLFCAAASCNQRQPAVTATTPIAPGSGTHAEAVLPDGTVVELELATDDVTRQQGLMYRESVPPGRGMLFIFPASEVYPFWMRNTMIPLDILWIDEAHRVVHVAAAVPPCTADPCPNYSSEASAKYVLELASGEAAKHKVRVGDALQLRNIESVVVR